MSVVVYVALGLAGIAAVVVTGICLVAGLVAVLSEKAEQRADARAVAELYLRALKVVGPAAVLTSVGPVISLVSHVG